MQELTLYKRCRLLNSRGSVLVGAVAISILMAIAGIGFMQVNTSSLNSETAALENEQAFRAAESGVWTGARWLRANYTIANNTYYPFGSSSYYLTINGMDVYTTVTISGPKDTLSVILTAEAYKDPSGSHQKTTATFRKSLSVNSASAGTYGEYGTFFDGASSGWPGFFRRIFDGRFHMNRSIYIYSTSKPGTADSVVFKNGLVTTGTKTNYNGNYGKGLHDNNNYKWGVQLGWSGGDSAQCDKILRSHFLSNQDNIALPTGLDVTAFSADPKKYDLPASYEEGEDFNQYRPTLVLSVKSNQAYYRYYYRPSGTPATRTCDSNYLPHGDGTIFIAPNHINIYGKVKGQITVCTIKGKSICPVDSLMYEDYNKATNSMTTDSSKTVLGLVAGKQFRFNHQWKKDFTGTSTQVTPPGTLYLNGSMIAVENSGTSWYGSEWWDYTYPEPYNFKLFGNHILNQWRTPTSGGGAQGILTFSHDTRLIKKVNPPGFPPARSENGLWTIALHGWSEKNGSNY